MEPCHGPLFSNVLLGACKKKKNKNKNVTELELLKMVFK